MLSLNSLAHQVDTAANAVEPPVEFRLFVSSTFRDLLAERDALARHCFPQARQRFAMVGRALVEIDLRWGLPLDESEERIAQLCLQEVERCRGNFVGILGSRYGHIPVTRPVPQGSVPAQWPEGASITEYEIRAGAFTDPPPRFARFYFRESSDPETEDPALGQLKLEIRRRGFAVRTFVTPDELSAQLLADLCQLAEDTILPDQGASQRLERELAVMTDGTIERPEVSESLNAFLASADGSVLCVTGAPGVGKSTALATWFRRARSLQTNPPQRTWLKRIFRIAFRSSEEALSDDLWLAYFAGNRAGEGRFGNLLRNFYEQIAATNLASTWPGSSLAKQLDEWQNALAGALAKHRRVVVIVDGIDDLNLDPTLPFHWLPPVHPRLKLILCGRFSRFSDQLTDPGWQCLVINPLQPKERCRVLVSSLARFGKTLPEVAAKHLATLPALESTFFLRLVVDELRLARTPEHLQERFDQLRELTTGLGLANELLLRLEEDHGQTLVCGVCRLLKLSRGGLLEGELRDRVLALQDVEGWRWSSLMQAFRRSVFDRDGRLGAFDPTIGAAIALRYLQDSTTSNQALVQLLSPYWLALRERGTPSRRLVEELPWQLWRTCQWQALMVCMSQAKVVAAIWQVEPEQCRLYFLSLQSEIGPDVLAELSKAWCADNDFVVKGGLGVLALALAEMGQMPSSLALARHAIDVTGSNVDVPRKLADRLTLGRIFLEEGLLSEAAVQLKYAESAFLNDSPPTLKAALEQTLGLWYLAAGNAALASELLGKSFQLFDSLGELVASLQSRHNRALAWMELGRIGDARIEMKLVAIEFKRLHHLAGMVSVGINLAQLEERSGRLKAALRILADVEAVARGSKDFALLGQILAVKARVAELTGNRDGAEQAQLERQQLAARAGRFDDEVDAMLSRVAIRLNLGSRGEALAEQLFRRVCTRVKHPPAGLGEFALRPETSDRLKRMEKVFNCQRQESP